jgi:DNA-binding response OmpR family regulator
MDIEKHQRLDRAETLMTAAICANELCSEVRAEIDKNSRDVPAAEVVNRRPLMSESTLSVLWNGKSLFLGHTLHFRLLERLSRRPNQYITHLDLLRDVWDDELLATATIRSGVRHLRQRLRAGGMGDLAKYIRGHNGRYILEI